MLVAYNANIATVVTVGVTFMIYRIHGWTATPFSACTRSIGFMCSIEIRANAIRIGSVVVVRITVVVDIGEIGSGIRDYPLGEPT